MPGERGFTVAIYLKLAEANLKARLDAGDIDQKTYDDAVKELRNSVGYGPAYPSGENLPLWADYRKQWVLSTGKAIGNSGLIEAGGIFYTPGGMELDPYSASYVLNNYYNLNADTMSEGERARLAEEKRRANLAMQQWQIEEARRGRELEAGERASAEERDIARQRLAMEAGRNTEEQWRREQELQFELQRERTIAGLEGPADWIARWNAQKMPNPYTQVNQPMGAAAWGQMMQQAAQRNLQAATTMSTEAARALSQGKTDWFNQLSTSAYNLLKTSTQQEKSYEQAKAIADKEARAMGGIPIEKGGAVPEMAGGAMISGGFYMPAGGRAATQPQTPPAPSWLSQFVPGQVAGQPITRQGVGTPSPQTWGATPWSVQQGLKGYAEWAGGEPLIDIIGRMESMIPIGGTAKRWLPRRQKTFV